MESIEYISHNILHLVYISVEISSCNNLYKFGCAHLLIFPKKYFI